jgi:hypothetical protein
MKSTADMPSVWAGANANRIRVMVPRAARSSNPFIFQNSKPRLFYKEIIFDGTHLRRHTAKRTLHPGGTKNLGVSSAFGIRLNVVLKTPFVQEVKEYAHDSRSVKS